MRTLILLLFFAVQSTLGYAQSNRKSLNFDHLFDNTFASQSVSAFNWTKDGRYYTATRSGNETTDRELVRYGLLDGSAKVLVKESELVRSDNGQKIRLGNYAFSADEQKLLIQTDRESIWRRSYLAHHFVFDLKTRTLKPLSTVPGRQSNAELSPVGNKGAYTRDNNLYWVDLETGVETAITTDGKANAIINGSTDWVYEEEFGFAKAWFWSPDASQIAFYRFDEREVPEFNFQTWGGLYPGQVTYKYPKAGEKNSVVTIGVYDLKTGKTQWMDLGSNTDQYIVRINWTPQPGLLAIRRMNRLQNTQDLLQADTNTGQTKLIKTESSKTWISVNDDLTFLNDGKSFIYLSEEDGWNHIYHYAMDGSLIRQVTKGEWEVTRFLGINEKTKRLYYMSTEASSMERHLYAMNLDGSDKRKLTSISGMNNVNVTRDFRYYVNTVSSNTLPTRVSIHQMDGKELKLLEDNQDLLVTMDEFDLPEREFLRIPAADGTPLNAWLIKPHDFDPNKRYPLLIYVYGGPGSQNVNNSFNSGDRGLWHMLLAQDGYLVACIDNRGTGGRGADFKKQVYRNLGKLETEDQIAAARWLGSQSYVDERRIGIWGWSYGGYMSSMALALGADVFKLAIAVAPVTDWRFYDTIYTERYMATPQLNATGYQYGAPIEHAAKIKGKYLLIHGTADDNVHFQNAVVMADALIKANVQFDTMFYPDKNHGIGGGTTRRHLYAFMRNYILENL
jgi:dipeptidyl-peptidase-4